MSIYKFLFAIFSLNLFIFIFFKPIGIEATKLEPENIPQIAFQNFTLFDIGSDNIVETAINGAKGMIFRNGKYEINEINIKYQNSKYIENLKSRYAYYNQGIIDVSHRYEKMYVIRPQFFIQIISLLRNSSLNS